MRAVAGDELLVRGRHVGDEDREGVIVEVRGVNMAGHRRLASGTVTIMPCGTGLSAPRKAGA